MIWWVNVCLENLTLSSLTHVSNNLYPWKSAFLNNISPESQNTHRFLSIFTALHLLVPCSPAFPCSSCTQGLRGIPDLTLNIFPPFWQLSIIPHPYASSSGKGRMLGFLIAFCWMAVQSSHQHAQQAWTSLLAAAGAAFISPCAVSVHYPQTKRVPQVVQKVTFHRGSDEWFR